MGSACSNFFGTNAQSVPNVTQFTNPQTGEQQSGIYGEAKNIYNQFAQNPSSLVAPFTPTQTAAMGALSDNVGAATPWSVEAQGMIKGGLGVAQQAPDYYRQGAGAVSGALPYIGQAATSINSATPYWQQSASSLANINPVTMQAWDPTRYLSPETDNVVKTTLANFDRNADITNNGTIGKFIKAGNAFGGDRAGVALAEDRRGQSMSRGQLEAQMRQDAYNRASQTASGQQTLASNIGFQNNAQQIAAAGQYGQIASGAANVGSQLGNLAATQAGIGSQLYGAGAGFNASGTTAGNLGRSYGDFANASSDAQTRAAQAAFGAGTTQQQTAQAQAVAPWTNLGFLTANSPGTNTAPTTQTTTYPGGSPAAGITGALVAGAGALGAYNNFNKGTGTTSAPSDAGAGDPGGTYYAADGGIIRGYASGGAAYSDGFLDPMEAFEGTLGKQSTMGGFSQPFQQASSGAAPSSSGSGSSNNMMNTIISTGIKLLPLLLKDGGAVPTFNDGGAVPSDNPVHEKYIKAFDAIKSIHRPEYALGGDVAPQPGGSPWMREFTDSPSTALMTAGLGMMARTGERDARGLMKSPLSAIGQGAMDGVNYVAAQQERQRKDYLAALERQKLDQAAQIAAGQAMVNGNLVPTLDAKRLQLEAALNPARAAALYANSVAGQTALQKSQGVVTGGLQEEAAKRAKELAIIEAERKAQETLELLSLFPGSASPEAVQRLQAARREQADRARGLIRTTPPASPSGTPVAPGAYSIGPDGSFSPAPAPSILAPYRGQ